MNLSLEFKVWFVFLLQYAIVGLFDFSKETERFVAALELGIFLILLTVTLLWIGRKYLP